MLYSLFTYILTFVLVILISFVSYLLWLGTHWKRKGVPSYGNAITGIFLDTFRTKRPISQCLKEMYHKNNSCKFYGTFVFGQPVLVIQDREILKQVMLKEFPNFASHGIHYDTQKDPLSGNLFNLASDDWRFMRAKLTPTFTSGKIKFMFSTVQDCVSTFHKAVDKERLSQDNLVDIRELLARLGTDIISSVAFGIEANSVDDNDSAFRKMGKTHFQSGLSRIISLLMRMNAKIVKLISLNTAVPEVNTFLLKAFSDTVEYREENDISRNDFMDLMIRLKNENNNTGDSSRTITTNDIAAQAFIFFVAGFETSSTTTGYTLLELAKHPDIQRKVQEECDKVMKICGGNVSYDVVQTMEYTDKVLHETMRMYPALPFLPRAVTKACKLPQTDITLEKDTLIWIPVHGLHMDEKLFPDPLKYDPERFSKENKDQIPHYAYMPFGEGPRQCIGMRFATVQMKAVLLELMTRYSVELSDEINPYPEFHAFNVILRPTGSFKLKMIPRTKN